jgi:hypothetical protein
LLLRNLQSQIPALKKLHWQNIERLNFDDMKKKDHYETLESFLPNLMTATVSREEYE